MIALELGKVEGSAPSNSPPPNPNWNWWQKVLGVIRKILNLGNAAGLWPSQKPKI